MAHQNYQVGFCAAFGLCVNQDGSSDAARLTIVCSVWRPLNRVIRDCPLALCNPHSVQQQNIVTVDKVHPDHVEEGAYLTHAASQEWYYLSDQTRDEVTVFVTWDSDPEGSLRMCITILVISRTREEEWLT